MGERNTAALESEGIDETRFLSRTLDLISPFLMEKKRFRMRSCLSSVMIEDSRRFRSKRSVRDSPRDKFSCERCSCSAASGPILHAVSNSVRNCARVAIRLS